MYHLTLRSYGIFLAIILLLSACSTTKKPYYSSNNLDWLDNKTLASDATSVKHSVFLIGDAGEPQADNGGETLQLLGRKLQQAGENSTVVFLGDNVYPAGLPDEKDSKRAAAEAALNTQLQVVEGFNGKVVFIPGNHDWKKGKSGGHKNVIRMEAYIEEKLQKGNTFLPDSACAGPVEVELDENTVLIAIDTQWFLQKSTNSKGENSWCDEVLSESDFLIQLDDALIRNQDKNVIVAGHHPVMSNSHHGGKFSWKQHLFPLTEAADNFYLPLPVVGSIYPGLLKESIRAVSFPSPKKKVVKFG